MAKIFGCYLTEALKCLPLVLVGVFGFTFLSSGPHCDKNIEIYEGPVFESGQSYTVEIDQEIVLTEHFLFSRSTGRYTKKADYCCRYDSCRFKFVLDDADTVFYIILERYSNLLLAQTIKEDHP